jgi:hypothetical protein
MLEYSYDDAIEVLETSLVNAKEKLVRQRAGLMAANDPHRMTSCCMRTACINWRPRIATDSRRMTISCRALHLTLTNPSGPFRV